MRKIFPILEDVIRKWMESEENQVCEGGSLHYYIGGEINIYE